MNHSKIEAICTWSWSNIDNDVVIAKEDNFLIGLMKKAVSIKPKPKEFFYKSSKL